VVKQRQVVALMLLSGTVALAGWSATTFGAFDSSDSEQAAAQVGDAGTRKASRLAIRSYDAAPAVQLASLAPPATSYLTLPKPELALAAGRVTAAATAEPVSPEPQVAAVSVDSAAAALTSSKRTVGSAPTPADDVAADDSAPAESTFVLASAPSTHVPTAEDTDPDAAPRAPGKLVNLFRPEPAADEV
jgi:hypothetical protein